MMTNHPNRSKSSPAEQGGWQKNAAEEIANDFDEHILNAGMGVGYVSSKQATIERHAGIIAKHAALSAAPVRVETPDASQFDRVVQKIDDAEQSLSQMYYLVTGRSPAWSKTFGHQEAIEEVKDALIVLRGRYSRADVTNAKKAAPQP
jgi:hypothetical protein